jgi:hypothetical protein
MDGYPPNEPPIMQMTMVGGLRASTRERFHTDVIQALNRLPPLIFDLDQLEHLRRLLSSGGKGDPNVSTRQIGHS